MFNYEMKFIKNSKNFKGFNTLDFKNANYFSEIQ